MRMCLINGMECVLLLAVRGKDGVRQIGYQRKVQVKPSGTRRGPSKGHPPGSPRLWTLMIFSLALYNKICLLIIVCKNTDGIIGCWRSL